MFFSAFYVAPRSFTIAKNTIVNIGTVTSGTSTNEACRVSGLDAS